MQKQLNPVRKEAVRILGHVLQQKQRISDAITAKTFRDLTPENRARAQRLSTETLRHLSRINHVLDPRIRKTPPPFVHNILRLGTWEILAAGEARHGVVNDLVTLCGASRRYEPYRGMVNAILRNVDALWETLPPPLTPDWLRALFVGAWGENAVYQIEAIHAQTPPTDLTLKNPSPDLVERLGATVLATNSVRLPQNAGRLSSLPGYGDWWVQDTAASLPARILNAKPAERVLDLCAAPGGKTLQLALTGADVTAVDISAARLERLQENLTRTGLSARVIESDLFDHHEKYDAVLLDAPCSATGTMRRHPELAYIRNGIDISHLVELQKNMLAHALSLVKPGGRLVFATCSLLPQEGEQQIRTLLTSRPSIKVIPPDATALGIEPTWRTKEGGVRLRPDYWGSIGGMDGFYAACLAVPM